MGMFPLTSRRLCGKVNNTLRKKIYRASLEPMIYLFPLGKSPIYKGHTFPRLACSPVTFSSILSTLFFIPPDRINCITLIKLALERISFLFLKKHSDFFFLHLDDLLVPNLAGGTTCDRDTCVVHK